MMSDDDLLISKPSVASMFRLQWEEVQQSWVLLYPEGMVKLNTINIDKPKDQPMSTCIKIPHVTKVTAISNTRSTIKPTPP